jgi:Domain of unknown function (DUF397)
MTESNETLRTWRKSSFSQNGDCVEITLQDRTLLVRDSKHVNDSVLAFSPSEWSAFLVQVRNDPFGR